MLRVWNVHHGTPAPRGRQCPKNGAGVDERKVAFLGSNGVGADQRCSTSLLTTVGANRIVLLILRKSPGSAPGHSSIFAWVCDRSGGNGAFALCGDFLLGAEPVLEVVAVFPAACLVEFICALADLVFKFLGFARYRCGWFLCRIFGHGGNTPLLQCASRVTCGGRNL